jgi:hypothetical protein
MKRKPVWYKTFVVGVIVLFIGVAIQPAIAEVSFEPNNSELVETTITICKFSGIKEHTLMLTQKQADELDSFLNDFKFKLDNALNESETINVYDDMIISLDELGLLPDYLTVDEAQQLVTGRNHLLSGNKLPSKLFDNSNFFCLVSGEANESASFLRLFRIPVRIGGIIYFGTHTEFHPISGEIMSFPAIEHSTGWIKTYGILGHKEWNGDFYGGIFNIVISVVALEFFTYGHVGVVGFTGILIDKFWDVSFIGFAPWVKIKEV